MCQRLQRGPVQKAMQRQGAKRRGAQRNKHSRKRKADHTFPPFQVGKAAHSGEQKDSGQAQVDTGQGGSLPRKPPWHAHQKPTRTHRRHGCEQCERLRRQVLSPSRCSHRQQNTTCRPDEHELLHVSDTSQGQNNAQHTGNADAEHIARTAHSAYKLPGIQPWQASRHDCDERSNTALPGSRTGQRQAGRPCDRRIGDHPFVIGEEQLLLDCTMLCAFITSWPNCMIQTGSND